MNTKNLRNLIAKIVNMIVQLAVTMAITSIVVGKLGNVANGYNQMANDFISYVNIFSIALNSMASRFITMSYYKADYRELNLYYNSVLFGDLILAISLSGPLIILTLHLDNIISIPSQMVFDVEILFGLMFVNFILNLCFTPYSVATFIKNRIDLDSFRNIEGTLVKFTVVILLFELCKPRIWYVSLGTLSGTLYYAFMNVYYTHKLVPEVRLHKKKYCKWKYIKQLLSSGVWNSFTQVGAIFLNGLDLVIANQFIGHTAMGVLAIAKLLPKYVFSAMASIASVFTPGVMIEFAKNDKDGMAKVINESIKLNSILTIIIEVCVIVLSGRLYMLWVPDQNACLLQKLSIVAMLGYIILMPLEVLWTAFTATNNVKISSVYLFIEAIVTICIVIVSLKFVKNDTVKIFVVAGTSSIMEIIRGLFFLPIASARILNLPSGTFYKPIIMVLKTFSICLIVSVIINITVRSNSWFIFVLLGIASVLCSFTICISLLFNSNERKTFMEEVKKRIIK